MHAVQKRLTLPVMLLLTASLLTACPGGTPAPVAEVPVVPGTTPSAAPVETGDYDLSLIQDSLTAPQGGSADVAVNVMAKGSFSGAVTFSVVGGPAGLEADFSPAESATQSVLTLNVPKELEAKTYDFFVKGSATVGGQMLEHTAALRLSVPAAPGITVGGHVRNVAGNPLSGATVTTAGQSVITGPDGGFTFSEVKAPYSLTVQPAGSKVTHTFLNLTRPDPTLPLYSFEGGAPLSGKATVFGTLSGGGTVFPVPAGQVAGVAFASNGDGRGGVMLDAGKGASYTLEASWSESSSVTGTVHALYGTLNPAVQTLFGSYSGYASRDVTLSNAGLVNSNLTFSKVQNSALSVKLALPAGVKVTSKRVFMSLGPRSFFLLGLDPGSTLVNTYPTPVVSGRTFGVIVDAQQGTSTTSVQRVGLAPNQVLDVSLPAAVQLQTPPDKAKNVAGASLDWSDVPDSVYILSLNNASRFVYTTSSSYNQRSTPGLSYAWKVISVGPFASMDDFTGPGAAQGYAVPGDDREFGISQSETRSFSTKG